MQKYTELSIGRAARRRLQGHGHPFYAGVISFGAAVGLTTVCMILLLGQTRVFFAMSRDGLLPRVFSRVHPQVRHPVPARPSCWAWSSRSSRASPAIDELAELVNIGTLFAFVVVAIGVIILRRTRPDLPRAFRTPLVPLVPVLSVLASLWLMLNLPTETWLRFARLDGIGFVVYFVYGRCTAAWAAYVTATANARQ